VRLNGCRLEGACCACRCRRCRALLPAAAPRCIIGIGLPRRTGEGLLPTAAAPRVISRSSHDRSDGRDHWRRTATPFLLYCRAAVPFSAVTWIHLDPVTMIITIRRTPGDASSAFVLPACLPARSTSGPHRPFYPLRFHASLPPAPFVLRRRYAVARCGAL
jgi:hypothetical protein